MTAHGVTNVIIWTCQMAINTENLALVVNSVCEIFRSITVTACAQGISGNSGAGPLGMDLVTVNTGHVYFPMAARLPLDQCAGVASATQIFGCSNHHTLFRVSFPVDTVTGLTGDASQHKLTSNGTVTSRMTGEALARFFHLLQISLEYWIK